VSTEGIQTKLEECFYLVFPELTRETINQASGGTVARWDSLTTITLLSLIGEKFNMAVDFEYFEGATSFGEIKERVKSLLDNA
jgi:acyl carrier protein